MKEIKPYISIDGFNAVMVNLATVDIRFCQIEAVEDVLKNPKKEFDPVDNPVKGYKLTLNTGSETRSAFTNICNLYTKEQLLNKVTTFILNLPPANIRGIDSSAMIFLPNDILISGGNVGDSLI